MQLQREALSLNMGHTFNTNVRKMRPAYVGITLLIAKDVNTSNKYIGCILFFQI